MGDRHYAVGRREAIITGCGVVASLLTGCTSTQGGNDTTVDLAYTKEGRLTGTFAGRSVNVASKLPSGQGKAGGSFEGEPVAATWQIAYNGTASQTVLPVTLDGSFAKQSLRLSATFRLMPNFLFDSGTVTGTSNGRPVHADVTHASGESSSSVNVDGSFAGTAFSLYATIAGDLRSGLIRGTVGGKPTKLTAKVESGEVAVCSLLYFLGGIYSV